MLTSSFTFIIPKISKEYFSAKIYHFISDQSWFLVNDIKSLYKHVSKVGDKHHMFIQNLKEMDDKKAYIHIS